MLENGTHATIAEIAAAEKINESYVGRILRLTLLAPDIVEAILNGQQAAGLQLNGLIKRILTPWDGQLSELGSSRSGKHSALTSERPQRHLTTCGQ
jgi:hypothetical protein